MDDIEYRTRLAVIRSAVPSEEFSVFAEKGIAKAKEIIIGSLKEKINGLAYFDLELLVEKGLELVNINNWNETWKKDAFMLALAGLKIEDEKVEEINGIFTLNKGHCR